MNYKTTSLFLKTTTFVLASISVVYAVKYYKTNHEIKHLKKTIQTEKNHYVNDLSEIFNRYDAELEKNKKLIIQINQLKSAKLLVAKKKHLASKSIQKFFVEDTKKIDSLNALILNYKKNLLESNLKIENLQKKHSILANKNKQFEELVEKTQNFTATNIFANGIKIVSNDFVETKKFNQTEQIKVCFTLLENKAILKGDKDIFIQIINPKNKVVSKHGENIEFGEQILFYSAKTNVFFDNDQLDVCAFIETTKSDVIKGDYEINIFYGSKIIGNATFSLK